MKVRKAEAIAFGPFAGDELELDAPMNVICGANEAGKSSWHAAIYAGICGRRRGKGAGTKAEQRFKEDHRPWDGDRWEVKVALDLADGREVELHQCLDEPANSRVTDRVTGKDVTAEFLSDGAPDASLRLGLSRGTMLATATVRQTEIRRVHETSKALQRQLQAATTKAGADETAQAALERIDGFFKENVGRRQANSVRPLQLAIKQVGTAETALAEARMAHDAYQGLREDRDAADAERDERYRELQAAQQTLDRLKLEALQDRLGRARALAGRLPEGEQPNLEAVREQVKGIQRIVTRFDDRPEVPEVPEGATAEELAGQLAALPEMPTGDTAVDAEVGSAHEAWRQARDAVRAHEKYRPRAADKGEDVAASGVEASSPEASGGELRRLADVLESTALEPDPEERAKLEALHARLRTTLWKIGARAAGAVLLVTAGGMAAMGISLPWWVGAAVLGMLTLVAGFLPNRGRAGVLREIGTLEAELAAQQVSRRRADEERRRAEGRLEELGLPADPEHLRSVALRQESTDVVRDEIERWQAEEKNLAESLAEGERALGERLAGRVEGVEGDAADLDAAMARYAVECEEHAGLAREAGKRSGLTAQLQARKSLEESAEKTARRRAAAEQDLVELAKALEVDVGDVDAAADALRGRAEVLGADYDRWNRAREDAAQLKELLAGRTLADLDAEVATAEASAASEDALDPMDLGDEPEAAVEALRERFDDVRGRLERLEGRIENEVADLVSVAEAEEDLEQAEAEQARVEQLEQMLGTTRDFLEAARERVQRDIAPHLKRALEKSLATVTGGRYQEARVDPANLEVTVKTSEGAWHSADRLSHGTMEQIYLLLRVALVRHMSSAGEPSPIFLDDPTVQSDEERTVEILEVLRQISEDHQIILFSQEEEVRRWAAEQQKADASVVRLIELTSPS